MFQEMGLVAFLQEECLNLSLLDGDTVSIYKYSCVWL